jgi:ribonuclease J
LAQDGLIVVVASVDLEAKLLLSGPDIVSRGFVYVREAEELMDEVKQITVDSINKCLDRSNSLDRMVLKTAIKDDVSKFLYTKTKRKPMVLPVIMNL